MAFKMGGYSGYHGDKSSPKKNVGYTKYGPKSAAFQKNTDYDPQIHRDIKRLQQEGEHIKDPNSNRGKQIKKALEKLGSSVEGSSPYQIYSKPKGKRTEY